MGRILSVKVSQLIQSLIYDAMSPLEVLRRHLNVTDASLTSSFCVDSAQCHEESPARNKLQPVGSAVRGSMMLTPCAPDRRTAARSCLQGLTQLQASPAGPLQFLTGHIYSTSYQAICVANRLSQALLNERASLDGELVGMNNDKWKTYSTCHTIAA